MIQYPEIIPILWFRSVEDALAPFSAGTESVLCIENCSGTTNTVSVNHPTWTNEFGKAVVQLDAIQLGGYNGYYA